LNEISFMPERKNKRSLKRQIYIKFILILLGVLLIIRTAFYLPSKALNNLVNYKAIADKEYSKNKDLNINIDLEKRSKAIQVINLQDKRLGAAFKTFNKYLAPLNVVDNIKLDYRGMTLSGKCINYFSIIKFISEIEKSKLYKAINIASIEYNKDLKIYTYIINITQLE
jgi:hypothetical protein